jgi:hypothetical protein
VSDRGRRESLDSGDDGVGNGNWRERNRENRTHGAAVRIDRFHAADGPRKTTRKEDDGIGDRDGSAEGMTASLVVDVNVNVDVTMAVAVAVSVVVAVSVTVAVSLSPSIGLDVILSLSVGPGLDVDLRLYVDTSINLDQGASPVVTMSTAVAAGLVMPVTVAVTVVVAASRVMRM